MADKPIEIKLSSPIKKGDDTIKKVELRKPKAGELRGLQLSLVQLQDVDTMVTLIPRISPLNERDVHNLEPEDFASLSAGVLGFFVNID